MTLTPSPPGWSGCWRTLASGLGWAKRAGSALPGSPGRRRRWRRSRSCVGSVARLQSDWEERRTGKKELGLGPEAGFTLGSDDLPGFGEVGALAPGGVSFRSFEIGWRIYLTLQTNVRIM